MKLARRTLLRGLGAFAAGSVVVPGAHAGEFPARSVRLLVGQPPGGQTDVIARAIALRFAEHWQAAVVVENQPGAAGVLAARVVAAAAPDGHTLLLASSASLANAPALRDDVGYDTLRDFALVGRVARVTYALAVREGLPAANVDAFVDLARRDPGRHTIATVGPGSNSAVVADLFARHAGVELLMVPYKGGAQCALAVLAGEADATFCDVSLVRQHADRGALRLLAVLGPTRAPSLPAVPTMAEAGLPGVVGDPWYAVVAPARTPAPIVDALRAALGRALADPALRRQFDGAGYALIHEPVAGFAQAVRDDRHAVAASRAAVRVPR